MDNIKSNDKKISKNLNKRAFIIVLLLIITVLGGTFAWYNYNSVKSKMVLTIGDIKNVKIQITPYQIRETMAPVTSYEDEGVVYSTVEVVNNNSTDEPIYVYYEINELDEELINNGLKYTITKSNTENGTYNFVRTGDFKNHNGIIGVLNTNISSNTTDYYRVYLWLDTNVGDQSNVQNMSLNISLNGKIYGIPSEPVLDDAMIPVTISNNGDVTTVSKTDSTWYDYENKQWANVVLVNENATSGIDGSQSREYYLNNLSNNVPVAEEDILAYYVWIPRYKYRIPSNKVTTCASIPESDRNINDYPECYDGPFTMLEEDQDALNDYTSNALACTAGGEYFLSYSYISEYELNSGYFGDGTSIAETVVKYNSYGVGDHSECDIFTKEGDITLNGGTFNEENLLYFSSASGSIDIIFESNNDLMVKGDAVNTYRSHPAFWNDINSDKIVDSDELMSGFWVSKFENTDGYVRNLPKEELDYLGCYDRFYSEFDSFDYGLNSNISIHSEIKHEEWGAIAYLTHSKYGINSNITSNQTNITGGDTYGTLTKYSQSTTGNISGIFDMAGGGDEILNSIIPYKLSSCSLGKCGGMALYETDGWYNSYVPETMPVGYWLNGHYVVADELFSYSIYGSDEGGPYCGGEIVTRVVLYN